MKRCFVPDFILINHDPKANRHDTATLWLTYQGAVQRYQKNPTPFMQALRNRAAADWYLSFLADEA